MIIELLIVTLLTVFVAIAEPLLSLVGISDLESLVGFTSGAEALGELVPFALVDEFINLNHLAIFIGLRITIAVAIYAVEFVLWLIDNLPVIGS